MVHNGTEQTVWRRIAVFLEMIKFSHTIFALPFALTGALPGVRTSSSSSDRFSLWVRELARKSWIIEPIRAASSPSIRKAAR